MSNNKNNKKQGFHSLWPIFIIPFLLIMVAHIFMADTNSGIISLAYIFVYSAIVLVGCYINGKKLTANLINYAMSLDSSSLGIINDSIIPCAYLSPDGGILWYNNSFSSVIGENAAVAESITDIIPGFDNSSLLFDDTDTMNECYFNLNDRFYKAALRYIKTKAFEDLKLLENTDAFIALYLSDETELNEYRRKVEDDELAIGLIYIDEVDAGMRESEDLQQSLIAGLIERQISKNMQLIDGIYRKMDRDRYFFIFRHKYLNVLKENKFSILESVRNIKLSNGEYHVTISIGIGLHADSFNKRYDLARSAIELALGRGGDQAVIKDGDKTFYYGGNNLQKDINTRVRSRHKAKTLQELLLASEKVYIMGHINFDIDAFGACVGIYSIAHYLGRPAKIVLSSDDTDAIKTTLAEYENNSAYDNFIIDLPEAERGITADTLLVVVDVNNPNNVQCKPLLSKTNKIAVIDHHRQTENQIGKTVLSYIEPFASSACEMVTELFQYIDGGIRPNSLVSDTLYSGIMIDTNNFTVQTSPRTFEAVTYLRRSSNDIAKIRKRFRCNPEEYMIRAQAISNTEIFEKEYAITTIPGEVAGNNTAIGAKVANSLLEMNNIKASFVLSDLKTHINISARSIDDVNVQLIMEKLGGGGHSTVAAAQLDTDIDNSIDQLKEIIKAMIEEGEL